MSCSLKPGENLSNRRVRSALPPICWVFSPSSHPTRRQLLLHIRVEEKKPETPPYYCRRPNVLLLSTLRTVGWGIVSRHQTPFSFSKSAKTNKNKPRRIRCRTMDSFSKIFGFAIDNWCFGRISLSVQVKNSNEDIRSSELVEKAVYFTLSTESGKHPSLVPS
jgi:hypothetical protein